MFSEILKIKLNSQTLPIRCITDSKSLHDAVYWSEEVSEKRLRKVIKIREFLEKGALIESVLWVNSKNQLADSLTKEKSYMKDLCKT